MQRVFGPVDRGLFSVMGASYLLDCKRLGPSHIPMKLVAGTMGDGLTNPELKLLCPVYDHL